MEAIITGLGDVTDVITAVFGVITGNPFTLFLLASSLFGVGLAIFRKVKKSAK